MLALRTVTYCTENEETPFFSNAHAGHRFAAILLVMQVAVLSSVGLVVATASLAAGIASMGIIAAGAAALLHRWIPLPSPKKARDT